MGDEALVDNPMSYVQARPTMQSEACLLIKSGLGPLVFRVKSLAHSVEE